MVRAAAVGPTLLVHLVVPCRSAVAQPDERLGQARELGAGERATRGAGGRGGTDRGWVALVWPPTILVATRGERWRSFVARADAGTPSPERIQMLRFVLSRVGQTLAVLFTASVLIFALMRLIPGDPVLMLLGDDFTEQAYQQLRARLGLDRSIVLQYLFWLRNVVQGDLGDSVLQHERVAILVWEALKPTVTLVVASLIAGVLIAVPSGIVAAMRKDTVWDYGSMGFAIFVYSMPGFWKGIILIWIFSVYFRWFPAMGYVSLWTNPWDGLWKLVLPALTLGTFFSGLVARIIRSSLLEVLEQDFIKAARAKGVRQAALVYRHALANALIPVVTVIGLQFGALLGGAVLTETVFAIPGMGRLTVNAILNRDYSVVQGTILVGVLLVVLVNLAVDLTYAFLNPKIRVT